VGKHTAADGSTMHPLVADALSRRAGVPTAAHDGQGSSTGWPEPEPGGGGAVGWPDDTRPAPDGDRQEADGGPGDRAAAPPASRRGWRRLFGANRAA